jgi:hypothetical protein
MTLPAFLYLYPGNTQLIQLQGLQDNTTGSFLNGATVTATLLDQRGNEDPVIDDLSLEYVANSNGNYQGTVPSTFSPASFNGTQQGGYQLQITAVQGQAQALYTIPVILRLRTS